MVGRRWKLVPLLGALLLGQSAPCLVLCCGHGPCAVVALHAAFVRLRSRQRDRSVARTLSRCVSWLTAASFHTRR